jgi:hypothetical protein
MVALTSNTTKVCDVSRTTIYRANSPTIYACVNELEFHCIYCQLLLLVEFPLYTQPCKATSKYAKHDRQMLEHKAKAWNLIPLNPRNFSPIGIHCQNGQKNLKGQYSESSSIRCSFLIMWVKSNARIQLRILGGNQTILRIKDCKKITRWRSINEWSKQSNDPKNQLNNWMYQLDKTRYQMKDRYYDKIKKSALNKMRKLPKVRAQIRILHLNTLRITWNPHSL